ncbi:unnamed protein product [Agarophyton chilense]
MEGTSSQGSQSSRDSISAFSRAFQLIPHHKVATQSEPSNKAIYTPNSLTLLMIAFHLSLLPKSDPQCTLIPFDSASAFFSQSSPNSFPFKIIVLEALLQPDLSSAQTHPPSSEISLSASTVFPDS